MTDRLLELYCDFLSSWETILPPVLLKIVGEFENRPVDDLLEQSLLILLLNPHIFTWRERTPCEWVQLYQSNNKRHILFSGIAESQSLTVNQTFAKYAFTWTKMKVNLGTFYSIYSSRPLCGQGYCNAIRYLANSFVSQHFFHVSTTIWRSYLFQNDY